MLATTRLQAQSCPYCGQGPLDAATALDSKAVPKPGDVTVCIHCANVMSFGPALELQKVAQSSLPPAVWKQLDEVRMAILQFHKQRAAEKAPRAN